MTEADLQALLVEWIGGVVGTADGTVDLDARLDELGLASRDAVMLAGELEERLDRTIAPTIAWEAPTIRLLAAALAAPTGAEAPTAAAAGSVPVAEVPDEAAGDVVDAGPGAGPARGAEPIAVVGLGCRLPGGVDGPDAFWDLLSTGRDVIGDVPDGRWESAGVDGVRTVSRRGGFLDDVTGFDAEYFGISPREATLVDPQQRLLLEVAVEALQHARIRPEDLRGTDAGVFVGISASEYGHLTTSSLEDIEPWTATGAALSIAANRISYALDLRGPSLAVDTACSSSLVALHTATAALRSGDASLALVGGVNLLLTPMVTASFDRAGALAPDGRCKSFGAGADGIGRAEGAGVVVLERLSDAVAAGHRVLAVVAGSAVNSDGRSNGLTAPNPAAQEAVLRRAWDRAGIDPATADYVEAHGTGTLLGDPIEASALGKVFGPGRTDDRPLLLGSVKSNLGHLEAAAGIAGVIKVVLAMTHGRLPATLHAATPNPHIDLAGARIALTTSSRAWPGGGTDGVARAGVSGFGFGGTNAHVVLEQYVADRHPVEVTATPGGEVLAVSGRTPARALAAADTLADALEYGSLRDVDPAVVARSLAAAPARGSSRVAVAGADRDELVAALRSATSEPSSVAADRPVFVFAGYGQQWPGMARGLVADPVFAATLDEVAAALAPHTDVDVRAVVAGGREPANVAETMVTLFAIQLGLVAVWRAAGVEPAAVIGHSMGEVAAAVAAGGLTLADGARVMAVRSRLLSGVEDHGAGAMALLDISADDLPGFGSDCPDVEVAVRSSPRQCTVAGPAEQIAALVERVEASGRDAWPLKVRGAGHSAAVEPVLPRLRADLAGITGSTPSIAFYSTVTGETSFDVEYWLRNARQTVEFWPAVQAAHDDGLDTFVEISAHPVALHAVRATLTGSDRVVTTIGTLRRDAADRAEFARAVASLHAAGHPGVLAARYPAGDVVDLPAETWQHTPFWFAARPATTPAAAAPAFALGAGVPLGGRPGAGRGQVWTFEDGAALLGPGALDLVGLTRLAEAVARHTTGASDRPGLRVTAAELDVDAGLGAGAALLVTCAVAEAGGATTAVDVEVFGRLGSAAEARWVRHGRASLTASGASAAPVAATPVPPSTATAEPGVPRDLAGITAWLQHQLGTIMGHTDGIDPTVPLTALGFDSLMATRARGVVEAAFDVPLPVRLLLQGLTLDGLAAHLAATALDPRTPANPPVPAATVTRVQNVPPRDPTERFLAVACRTALRAAGDVAAEAPGMTDDLGARPDVVALVEALRAAIVDRLGAGPEVTALLAAGTLERVADLVRPAFEDGGAGAGAEIVRTLRGTGRRRPLFLFHPAGGPTSVYQPLVDQLDPDQPVHGLERLDDVETVEAKAGRYVGLIRERQGYGPYRLMGWSLGGVLAYEVAQQLTAAGERVEFLASIDTILPLPETAEPTGESLLVARFRRFATYVSDTYGVAMTFPPGLAELTEPEQMAALYQAMTASGVTLPAGVLRHQYTSYVDARIAERWTPRPWAGSMVLYRARNVEALTTSLDPRYLRTDRTLGWDEFAPALEVVPVPGDHISMIDRPNVDVLAADLAVRLASLDAVTRFVPRASRSTSTRPLSERGAR